MKIYELPKCVVCDNPAMCLYAQSWVCGRCLEKAVNREKLKQKQILMEIRE